MDVSNRVIPVLSRVCGITAGKRSVYNMAVESRPQFVTVAEVAQLMRVSKMTVYRMIHSGELPAMRVGKSFRVPQAAVNQMIDAGLSQWMEDETGTTGR